MSAMGDKRQAYVDAWLRKSENDLTIARGVRFPKSGDIVTDGICFHCQQAVEKLLKAFLAARGVHFGKTHNLEMLQELCSQVDPEFRQLSFGTLTGYAVDVRYPEELGDPSLAEADEALRTAQNASDFVRRHLSPQH
jgi:HEPN domain-containing protein